jgi:hypothetical protein
MSHAEVLTMSLFVKTRLTCLLFVGLASLMAGPHLRAAELFYLDYRLKEEKVKELDFDYRPREEVRKLRTFGVDAEAGRVQEVKYSCPDARTRMFSKLEDAQTAKRYLDSWGFDTDLNARSVASDLFRVTYSLKGKRARDLDFDEIPDRDAFEKHERFLESLGCTVKTKGAYGLEWSLPNSKSELIRGVHNAEQRQGELLYWGFVVDVGPSSDVRSRDFVKIRFSGPSEQQLPYFVESVIRPGDEKVHWIEGRAVTITYDDGTGRLQSRVLRAGGTYRFQWRDGALVLEPDRASLREPKGPGNLPRRAP